MSGNPKRAPAAPGPAEPAHPVAETAAAGTALATLDFGEDAGSGFEHLKSTDVTIPFLQILQGLSPQLETVEGAKPGKLINTVSNELFDGLTGVAFVPCEFNHLFIEWKPRSAGGGFVGRHSPDSDVVAKAKASSTEFGTYTVERVSEDGKERTTNELIETYYVYGLVVGQDGMTSPLVIAFSGTKIKVFRRWMSVASQLKVPRPAGGMQLVPMFAQRYRLKTVKEKNNFGEFFNFASPAFDGPDAASCRMAPDHAVYQEAKRLRDSVRKGEAKAAEQPAGEKTAAADEPF